jgi:hypothetical protein
MRLPPATTPEGLFQYVIAFILTTGLLLLALFWTGIWTG